MGIEDAIERRLMGCQRALVFIGRGIDTAVAQQDPLWANAEAFYHSPEETYARYQQLAEETRAKNKIHYTVEKLARSVETLVVSLNIDGVESRVLSCPVVSLMGDISKGKCTEWECMFRGEYTLVCPQCGGVLRPDVVWEGESFSLLALDAIDDFIFDSEELLVVCIGIEPSVWPINGLIKPISG